MPTSRNPATIVALASRAALQKAELELNDKIVERTQQLQVANSELRREVSERERGEEEQALDAGRETDQVQQELPAVEGLARVDVLVAMAVSADTVKLWWFDADRGVVYYANYLRYFELARSEFLRAHGRSYRELFQLVKAALARKALASVADGLALYAHGGPGGAAERLGPILMTALVTGLGGDNLSDRSILDDAIPKSDRSMITMLAASDRNTSPRCSSVRRGRSPSRGGSRPRSRKYGRCNRASSNAPDSAPTGCSSTRASAAATSPPTSSRRNIQTASKALRLTSS